MDRLYRIITDVTLTTPLPPPYKVLYRFENMTEELKVQKKVFTTTHAVYNDCISLHKVFNFCIHPEEDRVPTELVTWLQKNYFRLKFPFPCRAFSILQNATTFSVGDVLFVNV